MDDFRLHIIEKIVDETGAEGVDEGILEVPPDPNLGDYAFPCFVLSKRLKKPPQQVAEFLKSKITPDDVIEKVESAGPYLNFFVHTTLIAESTLKEIFEKKEDYGTGEIGKDKTIVIEYPAPNTNKPLHLGHMRNMVLGDSISRTFQSQGYNVKRVNLNNDRGIHICKSMLAYQRWGEGKTPESEKRKSDHFVGDYYVMFCKKAKDDPELEKEAQEMLRKWEAGDKTVRALWSKMNSWAFEGFEETYKQFGIDEFDKVYYESETYAEGKKIVLEGLKKGVFQKRDDGAIVADLSEADLGEKVLLRADGTSVYVTQDLHLAQLKHKDFKFDRSVYVVATEQKYHFNVLFSVLRKLGYSWADGCYHFAYGMVHLPEGRMKSREGTVVDADDLILEMEELAKDEILKRHPELEVQEVHDRARIIGVGAIRFFLARTDALKDMTFSPEESIAFEGDTGPYVQYTHARACSILRKAKEAGMEDPDTGADLSLLKHDSEKALVNTLSEYPAKAQDACEAYKPHVIAQHLLHTARTFNEFYHACPCIQEKNKELAKARLLLIDCAKQVLSNGLGLLEIKAPEEM
jgi:arginyl-tRNA synthetase